MPEMPVAGTHRAVPDLTWPPRSGPNQLDSPILPVIFRHVGRAQVWLYRKTGGRIGGKWRVGAGFRKPVPTLLLDHVGRKSGTSFTVPLLYVRDGADVVVVASQGGRPEHPQWYRNLVANPDTYVQIGPERQRGAGRGRRRREPGSVVAQSG